MSIESFKELILSLQKKNPIEQKTPEWYEIRNTSIGGSEIATILGENKFGSIKNLIAERLGYSRFYGCTATRWGCIFEEVTLMWIEYILGLGDEIPLIETIGSLEGAVQGQRYSPDGIGIAKLNIKGILRLVKLLFEFKAPFSTIPTGKIPKQYIPQIKTGLCSIPDLEYCLFVNNCYRRCKLADLKFDSNYDNLLHKNDKKRFSNIPLAVGLIGFIDNDAEKSEELEVLDLGSIPAEKFDKFVIDVENKVYSKLYYGFVPNHELVNQLQFIKDHNLEKKKIDTINSYGNIDQLMDEFNKTDNVVAILPWKLFISDIILSEPDPNWADVIREPIKCVLEKIEFLRKSDNVESAYKKMFNIIEEELEDFTDYFN